MQGMYLSDSLWGIGWQVAGGYDGGFVEAEQGVSSVFAGEWQRRVEAVEVLRADRTRLSLSQA